MVDEEPHCLAASGGLSLLPRLRLPAWQRGTAAIPLPQHAPAARTAGAAAASAHSNDVMSSAPGVESGSCMGLDGQWQRLAGRIETAINAGRSAVEHQTAAHMSLDAAEYSLRAVREEIASVMPACAGESPTASALAAADEPEADPPAELPAVGGKQAAA